MKSSELKGFLTGLLIGDGHIDKGVTKRAFRIKSIDIRFIEKIKEELDSCTPFHTYVTYTPQHYSAGCNHKDSWELNVKAHPYFNKIYHKFYNDYRKRIITKYIPKYMTPYGIATWFMSDGYTCLVGKTKGNIKSRRIDFCTDRYTFTEVECLQKMLQNKFHINCSIITRNNTYRIRILSSSYETFFNLVFPYIIPTMQYKLYLGYEYQPEWMSNTMWNIQNSIKSAITLTDNAEGKI